METKFVTFNAFEDALIQIKSDPDLEDVFTIELKDDLHLLPYVLFKHFSNIRITPNDGTYIAFTIPSEEPILTHLTVIPELADNGNLLSFFLYNITGKELVLPKDSVIGYIRTAKLLTVERDIAYYSNDYILVRELKPNTIKNFSYVIDPKGRHSLVLKLNRRFFDNPFDTTIPLNNKKDNVDN